MIPPRYIDSFYQKFRVSTNGCWEWTRGRFNGGYGKFNKRAVKYDLSHYAHRTSWIIHFGPIPEGLQVCHRCDNPGCVNPQHLFLGTSEDNMQDASRKGRMNTWRRLHGAQHGRAKLTLDQVRSIQMDDRPRKDIAREYGVSLSRVSKIKQGNTWKKDLFDAHDL